jgi:proline-specific peptidase
MMTTRDGYIDFAGYKTYYKIVGTQKEKRKSPVLVIAGGPGGPHNYLLDIRLLSDQGREVIFYDQLGCGLSDKPEDDSLWTVDLFLNEIAAVRQTLGLKELHILGHSWGGMLAIDYLLSKPAGVRSVILASAMVSIPLFQTEVDKLVKQLPSDVWQTIRLHEAAGTVDDPQYQQAYREYTKRHILRQDELPVHLQAPPNSFATHIYRKLWGLSECCVNGELKDWDRIKRLPEISVPTLIVSGKYDELTPKQAAITKDKIVNSEQIIFEHSAHMPHIEEVGLYIKTVGNFLEKVEAA